MKELEVYVRSSALGKTGIHWRKVESSQSVLGYPDMLEKRLVKKNNGDLGTIEYKINYQKLFFVLMRHSQQLLFLVGGIEALEERSNQLGSTIYNAVAWVANLDESNSIPSENELTLRHLAARALLSFVGKDKDPEFINTINEAINFKGLEEFYVEREKIDQLTKNLEDKLDNAEGNQEIWDNKIETSINDPEIFNLAEKLIETKLPEDDFAILIKKVNDNEVSVLSIDINPKKTEIPQVEELPHPSTDSQNTEEKGASPMGKPKILFRFKLKMIAIIVVMISVLVTLIVMIKVIQYREEEPQKIPLPQTLISPQKEIPVQMIDLTVQEESL